MDFMCDLKPFSKIRSHIQNNGQFLLKLSLLPGAHKAKEHVTTSSNCCQIPNSVLTKYGYSV